MYRHREAMRKFKWEHPYLYTMLGTFVALLSLVICGILGCSPILLAAFVHWSGIFSWLITIPLAVTEVKFATDLFDF